MTDDLKTLAEAGALIGRSPSTLRHQVQNGRLSAVKYGKTYLVTVAELMRYVREVARTREENGQ